MEVDLLDQLTGGQPDLLPLLCTVALSGDQISSIHSFKKIQDFFPPKAVPNGRGAQNTTSGLFSIGNITTSRQN